MPLSQETAKSVTDIVAYGGVTSPVWFWPILEVTSNIATSALPILSAIWILVRVVAFVMDKWREHKDRVTGKDAG